MSRLRATGASAGQGARKSSTKVGRGVAALIRKPRKQASAKPIAAAKPATADARNAAGARRAPAAKPKPGHALRPTPIRSDGAPLDAANAPLQGVPHGRLTPAPWNARRDFTSDAAKQALAGLADAIASEGLLQNIVVNLRQDARGAYYIVAGERRWRAIGLLIQDGRWEAERPIPARIIAGTEQQLRLVNLLENLQRTDLTVKEEADGFAQLAKLWPADSAKPATQAIADRIGKSIRYVQERIAFANTLSPDAQKKLELGEINVTEARALVMAAKPAKQAELLREIEGTRRAEAHRAEAHREKRLLDDVFDALPRVGTDIFPLAEYIGGFHERKLPAYQGGKTVRHFADADAFWKLQRAAVKRKAEALSKKWPWVEIENGDPLRYPNSSRYAESKAKTAGAVIWIKSGGEVVVRTRQVKTEPVAGGKTATAEKAAQQRAADRRQAIAEAREAFTGAVTAQLAARMTAGLGGPILLRLLLAELRGGSFGLLEDLPFDATLVADAFSIADADLPAALVAAVPGVECIQTDYGVTQHRDDGEWIEPHWAGLAAALGVPIPEPLKAPPPKPNGSGGKAPAEAAAAAVTP